VGTGLLWPLALLVPDAAVTCLNAACVLNMASAAMQACSHIRPLITLHPVGTGLLWPLALLVPGAVTCLNPACVLNMASAAMQACSHIRPLTTDRITCGSGYGTRDFGGWHCCSHAGILLQYCQLSVTRICLQKLLLLGDVPRPPWSSVRAVSMPATSPYHRAGTALYGVSTCYSRAGKFGGRTAVSNENS
jgi:hypothetical protein